MFLDAGWNGASPRGGAPTLPRDIQLVYTQECGVRLSGVEVSPQTPISLPVGARARRALVTTALVVVAAGVMLLAAACSRSTPASLTAPTVPVTVASVEQRTVPVQVRGIGTAEAYSTVSVKAQVAAELTAVHFQEGQDVRAGDLLFSLDRRPFEATPRQTEANLARDIAQAEN